MKLQPNTPHYFFDDALMASQHRLTRRWLPATIYPQPVIEPDREWEGRMVTLFGSILPQQDGGYRMYYSSFTPDYSSPTPTDHARVLLAQSEDGFRWHKPELNAVEWRGSPCNNIVFAPPCALDSPNIIHEPDDADAPYKMLGFHLDDLKNQWGKKWGLYAYQSRDGLQWQPRGKVLSAGDRTSLMATKVDGQYVAFTRRFPPDSDFFGGRAIWRTQSEDFLDWSQPELVLVPDLADEPDVEFYGMSVFERHGWHIGLLEYWRSESDVLDIHLAFSRDGKQWLRPQTRAPFIAATYDWNRKWSTCASNGPIIINEQMVFYFGGRAVSHDFDSAQQHGAIGYASLPLDRFCALEGRSGGRFDTVPMEWPGGDLVINADTRQSFTSHPAHCNGEIIVEVLDAQGEILPEWSGDAKAVFGGNTHCRGRVTGGRVLWPEARSLDALREQTIRLRFTLNHARLFTLTAQEAQTSNP